MSLTFSTFLPEIENELVPLCQLGCCSFGLTSNSQFSTAFLFSVFVDDLASVSARSFSTAGSYLQFGDFTIEGHFDVSALFDHLRVPECGRINVGYLALIDLIRAGLLLCPDDRGVFIQSLQLANHLCRFALLDRLRVTRGTTIQIISVHNWLFRYSDIQILPLV